MYQTVELYEEPRKEIFSKLNISEKPEMSEFDSAFLCGMLKKFRPAKIMEVGIGGGGTTAIIMQCMYLLGVPYELHSVDLNEKLYRGGQMQSGYMGELAKEWIPDTNQKFHLGKLAHECMDQIGGDIDFLILDTVHALPGELLDFLALFPYLKEGAVVVLHDITCNYCTSNRNRFREMAYCTKILFDCVTAPKYLVEDTRTTVRNRLPNIGAFVYTKDTKEHISDVVSALSYTWYYMPNETQLKSYQVKILQNLDAEGRWLFESAVKINKDILNTVPDWKS